MWFIDIIRRQQEDRFLRDLMATKGVVDFVSDRRARHILAEMRFDRKMRLYFAWTVQLLKWAFGKLTRKKVVKEEPPVTARSLVEDAQRDEPA